MNSIKDDILVAISGGVDSSVSTLLLKKEYEVRTLSFSIFDEQEEKTKVFKDRIRQLTPVSCVIGKLNSSFSTTKQKI